MKFDILKFFRTSVENIEVD